LQERERHAGKKMEKNIARNVGQCIMFSRAKWTYESFMELSLPDDPIKISQGGSR
jgi:hypothetical protein